MADELDVGSIILKIRADASGIQEGIKTLQTALLGAEGDTAKAAEGIDASAGRMTASVQSASMAQAAAYAAISAAAVRTFQAIVGAMDAGINASERYKAAMIGLKSVASGTGAGFENAIKGADELTDAFFNSAAAATSLKNLLSRGYNLEQAVNTIKRLKDAAAFGRQGTLSLAEAVQSATEGLKNENSVLVDNAGVTKNVSVMHKEYAAALGTTVDKLTQAQKVEAEYAGIIRETQHQVGDLAKASDTLTGKQAEAAQSGELLARAYGEEMTPAVKLLTQAQGDLSKSLTSAMKEFPGVAAGASSAGLALAGFVTAAKGWQALKTFNTQLTAMGGSMTLLGVSFKTAFPWVAALSVVIGVAVGAWSNHKRAQEEAVRAEEEAAQKRREHLKTLRENNEALAGIKSRYEELAKKTGLTYSESEELLGIQKTLASQYGINVSALDSLGGAYQRVVKEINNKIAASERELQADRELAAQQAIEVMDAARADAIRGRGVVSQIDQYRELTEKYQRLVEVRKQAIDEGNRGAAEHLLGELENVKRAQEDALLYLKNMGVSVQKNGQTDLLGIEQAYKDAKAAVDAEAPAVTAAVRARMEEIAGIMRESGVSFSDSTKNALSGIFEGLASLKPQEFEAYMNAYAQALGNADIGPAVEAMQAINDKILSGAQPTEADMTALEQSWGTLSDFVYKLIAEGYLELEQFGATMGKIAPLMAPTIAQVSKMGEAPAKAMAMWKESNIAAVLGSDTAAAAEAVEKNTEKIKDAVDKATRAGEAMAESNAAVEGLTLLRDAFAGVGEASQQEIDATIAKLKEMGVTVPGSLSEAELSLNNYSASQAAAALEVQAAIDELISRFILFSDALQKLESEGQGDSQQAIRLRGLIAEIDEANKKLSELSGQGLKLEIDADTKPLQQRLDEAVKKAGDLKKALSEKTNLQAQASEVLKVVEAQKKGKASAEDWSKAQKIAAEALGYTGNNAEEMGNTAAVAMAGLSGDAQRLQGEIEATAVGIQHLLSEAAANPSLNIDTSPAQRALQGLIDVWNTLAKVLGLNTIGNAGKTQSRGGGGGGGKSSQPQQESPFKLAMDELTHDIRMGRVNLEAEMNRLNQLRGMETSLEEVRQLAERREEVWKALQSEKLSRAYAQIDYQKAIDQMSLSEEIKALERIKRDHSLSDDEQMDWETKYHDALKRQKDYAYQWDMALLDHKKNMGELILAQEIAGLEKIKKAHELSAEERMRIDERLYALRSQLQDEALKNEQERINSASEGIKRAYSAIVAALKNRYQQEKDLQTRQLDERIKALDDLTQAENEQKRRSDYASSLADKQRELSVTKSARKRRELMAEIAKMEADEELRRTQADRQDEKTRLQAEKQAIQDRYARITSEENLRQEALRMVMSRNLEEMSALIASYGNDWKDAGAQLAEYLTQGIGGIDSSIIKTIENLNRRIQESVNRQIDLYSQSIPVISGGKTTVTINNNGWVIREEADIRKVADAIRKQIDAERR